MTDAGVEISDAQFGAFFYNVVNEAGESYTLYSLSGVPRENFSKFPMPRNTHVFGPTFRGSSARTTSLRTPATASLGLTTGCRKGTCVAFARRQPLDPKPVNANQLITSMQDLLRRTIGPLHALEFVTAGGLSTTLCNPNQLESAILRSSTAAMPYRKAASLPSKPATPI